MAPLRGSDENGGVTQRFSTPIHAKEARLGGPVFVLGWIMESAARTGMVGEERLGEVNDAACEVVPGYRATAVTSTREPSLGSAAFHQLEVTLVTVTLVIRARLTG